MQHELVPLLRQSVYSRLAGYEDTNDAVKLARDPAMQAVVGRRVLEKQAASTSTLSRFETEVLVTEMNLKGLGQLNAEWVDRVLAKVEWHWGELFPRVGFIVTNLARRIIFQLAEVAVPRDLFATILGQVAQLRLALG